MRPDVSAGFTGGSDNAVVIVCLYEAEHSTSGGLGHKGRGIDLYFSSVADAKRTLELALVDLDRLTEEDFANYREQRRRAEEEVRLLKEKYP